MKTKEIMDRVQDKEHAVKIMNKINHYYKLASGDQWAQNFTSYVTSALREFSVLPLSVQLKEPTAGSVIDKLERKTKIELGDTI